MLNTIDIQQDVRIVVLTIKKKLIKHFLNIQVY